MGAVLRSSSDTYLLLPGQYTSNVQPTGLSQSLTSATSTLTFTTGFSNSTAPITPSLPLNIALLPGLLKYSSDRYAGDPTFIPLPQSVNSTFNPTSINGSVILAVNTVATIEADNNGAKNRIVLWDTVPYISQLPYSMAGDLQVLSLQSTTCSPACSSSAVCSTAGTCLCRPGFTGASCEACASGFWGPECKRESSVPSVSFFLNSTFFHPCSLPNWLHQMRPRNYRNRCLSQSNSPSGGSINVQLRQWRVLLWWHLHLLPRLDDRHKYKRHSMQHLC